MALDARALVARSGLDHVESGEPVSDRIEALCSSLTLEEKCSLLAGTDFWHLPAIERLGIPALKVSDGPSGVRGERWTGRPSALFPCGSALGATWDPAIVERVGA